MKLCIDTSNSEEIRLKFNGKNYKTEARKNKSQKLLPFIYGILEKNGKVIEDINEIEVNIGPGSFTGLRVGVTVAITIGWALDIPVNGKNLRKGETVDILYN